MPPRKLGVVVHGPEIVDSGWAERIIGVLEKRGEVKAVLGGTMGRTAVIDASLEHKIDISESLKPSEAIRKLSGSGDVDEIYLLNHGKSEESGDAFGVIVLSHVGRVPSIGRIPIVQIDMGSRRVIPLTENSISNAEEMGNELGIKVVKPHERDIRIRMDSGKVHRKIHGVFPGESILLNGIVIGKANSSNVEIVSDENGIREIRGGEIKEHGIEKLGDVNLEKAIIKTGTLRRTEKRPRVLARKPRNIDRFTAGESERPEGTRPILDRFTMLPNRAVMIFHSAENTFEIAKDADVAVTIGDDTTAIAGDVLYRFGIPIIGITDGDADNLIKNTHFAPGSTIVRLESGYDDEMGLRIREKIFRGDTEMEVATIDDLKNRILGIAEGMIVDLQRNP
jgi:hypothetical protein